MARKKLAPPTSRRRGGRKARQVNLGWWGTVGTVVLIGVLGVIVSRGEGGAGDITRTVTVPEIAGAKTISVTKVEVVAFDRVEKGDLLLEVKGGDTTEKITAPITGIITALGAAPGQDVKAGQEVLKIQKGADFTAHDHWHTAYGVNVCGEWLPPIGEFTSDFHTHGDGLVHIHPASTSASGDNGTLGLFFDRAGLELTATKLEYSDGKTYRSGEVKCGEGKDEKRAVMRWALNGEEQTGNPANYVAGNGDVIAIAFLPEKDDFDTLPPSASHLGESYVPPNHPDYQGATTATTFPTDAPASESPSEPAPPVDTTETTTAPAGDTTATTAAATPTSGG